MPSNFFLFTTPDPSELIIEDRRTTSYHQYGLRLSHRQTCPFCFYPLKKTEKCNHHIGIEQYQSLVQLIIGGYYQQNYNGRALNWWTSRINTLRENPFNDTHDDFKLVMLYKLRKYLALISNPIMISYIATSNLQSIQLFHEIQQDIQLPFLDLSQIISIHSVNEPCISRLIYVKQKYQISSQATLILHSQQNISHTSLILFDDVFCSGATLGRYIELLYPFGFQNFILLVLGRVIGIQSNRILKYPRDFLNIPKKK